MSVDAHTRAVVAEHERDCLREEIERLRGQLEVLRRQIRFQGEGNARRNVQLDALGIVWCSGGCPHGMHRYHPDRPITAAMVAALEHNAERARLWYTAHRARDGQPADATAAEIAAARDLQSRA